MDQIDHITASFAKLLEKLQRPTSSLFESEESRHVYDFQIALALKSWTRKYRGQRNDACYQKALSTFQGVESRLVAVNHRLKFGSLTGVEGIISDARRKISKLLGDDFDLNWLARHGEWGPGATSTLKRRDAALDKKILESRLSCTPRAVPYALALLSYDTSWLSARLGFPVEGPVRVLKSELKIVDASRFTTVEKDSTTDRSIDIQPTLNLFLQKGVGKVIRQRLKSVGVNLDDQSMNQIAAEMAFKSHYATIDLAAASDSVSLELVRLLLPPAWVAVMEDLRTDFTSIKGSIQRLNKFSSMGNGFTFELESLIFWAICSAVIDRSGSDSVLYVYGDDIVVSSAVSKDVIAALVELGFEVNVTKTFTEGLYYESCGKHFYAGVDVTPIFQKETVEDLPSFIRCYNRIFRWGLRLASNFGREASADVFSFLESLWRHDLPRSWSEAFKNGKLNKCWPIFQPWYFEGDGAMLTFRQFTTDGNGRCSLRLLEVTSLKRTANNYALLATSLRRGVVVDSPFYGALPRHGGLRYRIKSRERFITNTGTPNLV